MSSGKKNGKDYDADEKMEFGVPPPSPPTRVWVRVRFTPSFCEKMDWAKDKDRQTFGLTLTLIP